MVNRIVFCSLLLLVAAPLLAVEKGALRDPLRPIGYQQPSTGSAVAQPDEAKIAEWRLGAVLVATDRTVAVINGQSLQVGDLFDGYKLVEIKPSRVVLQKKQKKVVLRRSGTGLRKASSSQGVSKGSQP